MKNILHAVLHVLQHAKIFVIRCQNLRNSVFYSAKQVVSVKKGSFGQRMVAVFYQNNVVVKMKSTRNVAQLALKLVIRNPHSVLDNVFLVASVLVRTTFVKATVLAVLAFHVKSVQNHVKRILNHVKTMDPPKRFLLPCFFSLVKPMNISLQEYNISLSQ